MIEKKVKKLTGVAIEWPSIVCNDYPTLKNILIETDSWLVAPTIEFSESLERGEVIELSTGEFDINTEIGVMENSNRSRSPAASVFIKICQDYFDSRIL